MTQEEIYALIGKALKGEASEEELHRLNSWKNSHDHNTDIYSEVAKLWEKYRSMMEADLTFDAEYAWQAIENEIDQVHTRKPGWLSLSVMKVAASISILTLIGAFIYQQFNNPDLIELEGMVGEVRSIVLEDGSKIWLNRNSQLLYPGNFGPDTRVVHLRGEGYFEISPDADRPFIIQSKYGNQIKVVGTSFNYQTHPDSSIVSVVEGVVQMESDSKSLLIEAGEKGVVKQNVLTKSAFSNPNLLSWKTGMLTFENASLKSIIHDLKRHYGAEIQLEVPSENCTFTSSFNNESLENVLDEITLVLNLEWSIDNDKSYLLQGNGCN